MVSQSNQGQSSPGGQGDKSKSPPKSGGTKDGRTQFRPPSGQDARATDRAHPPNHAPPVPVEDPDEDDTAHDLAPGRPHASEVRAGPGDAGAADRPRVLPRTARSERRRREAAILIVFFLILSALITVVLMLL